MSIAEKPEKIRTGDVINLKADAYDKRGNLVNDVNIKFSFTGKSFDKSNTASGLIDNDGRFVADVAGNYLVTVSVGNVTNSQALNVYQRNVKRDVVKVGKGLVNDKHTSDFWVFEGADGKDYAVTGTWGADGTTYFWDVTDPANILKLSLIHI